MCWDLTFALLGRLVVVGAGVLPLSLTVLPLVPALVSALVLALVFLFWTTVLLIGALVARFVFLNTEGYINYDR